MTDSWMCTIQYHFSIYTYVQYKELRLRSNFPISIFDLSVDYFYSILLICDALQPGAEATMYQYLEVRTMPFEAA